MIHNSLFKISVCQIKKKEFILVNTYVTSVSQRKNCKACKLTQFA